MKLNVALIGAGGKMGFRIASKLSQDPDLELHCAEINSTAIERLSTLGLSTTSLTSAVKHSDVAVMAVPDALLATVAKEIVNTVGKELLIVCLDPAAAYANVLPLKAGISIFVCHPCHPMLFDSEITADVASDFHGGRAIQDVVCALHKGGEAEFELGVSLARRMFAPVRHCYSVSVEQMAMLEPALVESVAATFLTSIRELHDAVVARGVPAPAARSFLLGHLRLELGIIFEFADFSFSDGAKLAMNEAKQTLLSEGWIEEVLSNENIMKTVRKIVGASPC